MDCNIYEVSSLCVSTSVLSTKVWMWAFRFLGCILLFLHAVSSVRNKKRWALNGWFGRVSTCPCSRVALNAMSCTGSILRFFVFIGRRWRSRWELRNVFWSLNSFLFFWRDDDLWGCVPSPKHTQPSETTMFSWSMIREIMAQKNYFFQRPWLSRASSTATKPNREGSCFTGAILGQVWLTSVRQTKFT